jgi:hypothetical protein
VGELRVDGESKMAVGLGVLSIDRTGSGSTGRLVSVLWLFKHSCFLSILWTRSTAEDQVKRSRLLNASLPIRENRDQQFIIPSQCLPAFVNENYLYCFVYPT